MWVIQLNTASWVCPRTPVLPVTLNKNQLQEKCLCVLGSRTLVPISWMCKKQTSASLFLQNQKLIRWMLDQGYLLLTYETWWWKCYVHRRVPNHQTMGQQATVREITNPNPNQRGTEMLINCHVWTTSPRTRILLKASLSCTFGEDGAVIPMISKRRRPTMRHVPRTHRVALIG